MKFIIATVLLFVALASAKEVWEDKAYKNYESDKFDDYMKEIGVGWFLRKIGNTVSPTVQLKKLPNNKYELVTTSTFKDSTITFELGKEFEEETLDGRKVKSVITLEGNKLIQNQGGNPPSTIIREFGPKEMIATMKVNDVVCTRKYRTED